MNLSMQYFKKLGIKVSPIKLYGAIELAPSRGLAEYVCDLTVTGATLKENGLTKITTLFRSTATLIANKISMKYHNQQIQAVYEQLKSLATN